MRSLSSLPCNPTTGPAVTAREQLQALAQEVWAKGEDAGNMGTPMGEAFEAELKERLEALLCTLDRYNDL
jgi:hypothetical protein